MSRPVTGRQPARMPESGFALANAGATAVEEVAAESLRWEWRTFTRRGDPRLLALIPADFESTERRRETYLLSARSPHNIKVRSDHVEVKLLEQRDESGLELWRPTLRAPLPVDASALRQLFDAWRVPAPALNRDWYSLGAMRREIIAPCDDLAAVSVSKRRAWFAPGEDQGEFVEMTVRGEAWWSVALEDPDPERVKRLVERHGLTGFVASGYPAVLKHITRCLPG